MSAPEYQSVPVTMLDWRETRDLLPDQKFIFSYLWWARESNWCGVYLLPIEATAARLSLTARALEDALAEFRRRRLIDMDDDTGEIYIEKWLYCRHNTGARFEIMWESSMAAVRSRRLWEKANKAKNSIKSRLHDANGNGNKNGNKNKAVAPSATNSNDIRCATDDNAATQTQKKQKQK
ncbi:MAG: hypothetical protein LBE15_00375, partial [Burkholderiales bacterium]|nr:hypothetical protein [Burkholderiales bacterium]